MGINIFLNNLFGGRHPGGMHWISPLISSLRSYLKFQHFGLSSGHDVFREKKQHRGMILWCLWGDTADLCLGAQMLGDSPGRI